MIIDVQVVMDGGFKYTNTIKWDKGTSLVYYPTQTSSDLICETCHRAVTGQTFYYYPLRVNGSSYYFALCFHTGCDKWSVATAENWLRENWNSRWTTFALCTDCNGTGNPGYSQCEHGYTHPHEYCGHINQRNILHSRTLDTL